MAHLILIPSLFSPWSPSWPLSRSLISSWPLLLISAAETLTENLAPWPRLSRLSPTALYSHETAAATTDGVSLAAAKTRSGGFPDENVPPETETLASRRSTFGDDEITGLEIPTGQPIVYVGSKTGRDGIHGATMASAEFDDASEEKRPTVQVGDPFVEKKLIEACLELMATDAIAAIQDMGAAGLTSSSVEMASKGGLGMEMDLDLVPAREEAMSAYELMLSESQERMLMVLKPGRESEAEAIFLRWGLDFAVVGSLTDTGRMVVHHEGRMIADMPLEPLADGAPEYDRPYTPTPLAPQIDPSQVDDTNITDALKTLRGCSEIAPA